MILPSSTAAMPTPPPGAEHEQGFARAQLRALFQGVVGGGVNHGESRRGGEVHVVRDLAQAVGGNGNIFGEGAQARHRHDPVAGLEFRQTRAGFAHHAGAFRAGYERHLGLKLVLAANLQPVGKVQRGGEHFQQRLVRAGRRPLDLVQREILRRAVGMTTDGEHRGALRRNFADSNTNARQLQTTRGALAQARRAGLFCAPGIDRGNHESKHQFGPGKPPARVSRADGYPALVRPACVGQRQGFAGLRVGASSGARLATRFAARPGAGLRFEASGGFRARDCRDRAQSRNQARDRTRTQAPKQVNSRRRTRHPQRRPPAAQSAAIALRKPLHYLALDESLALLSDAPWESADHAESRQLLANILRALGKELVPDAAGELAGPAVPPGDPKSHPRARQNKRDTSPAAPLENLCRRDRCANLLIFAHYGNDLFPDLAPTTTDFRRDIGGIAMRVTVTRGLREMIAFPNLKKQCWQQLQPLRARLN